jgi:hypothetical protein
MPECYVKFFIILCNARTRARKFLMSLKLKPVGSFRYLLLVMIISLLGGCFDSNDECDEIVSTAGEPDMTAAAVFAAGTVAQGGMVDVNIAVDEETLGGTVYLLPVGSQDVTDQVATSLIVPVVAGSAETVTVTLTVDGAAALGNYYPAVVLCNIADAAMCNIGAGYVEDISGILADSGNYVRGTADGGTVDLSSLKDSCININRVGVI